MSNQSYQKITVESEGLTVSLIVWRKFKKPMIGLVEEVYELNQNLAELGPHLPVGTTFLLPIPAPEPAKIINSVRLW